MEQVSSKFRMNENQIIAEQNWEKTVSYISVDGMPWDLYPLQMP
jgi:hypothetical protein